MNLSTSFKDLPVLISQPFYSDYVSFIGQILYSKYNVYEIIPAFQPLLNYLAGGLKTGLVVDIGHFITQVTPMVSGTIVTDGVELEELGGKDITELLITLLRERNAFDELDQSQILSRYAIADSIKELYGYVSRNPADELDEARETQNVIRFPLIGGESIVVGVERFLAPEVLFMQQKEDAEPIDDLIYRIVSKYDPPVQQAFLRNILLTGGTSLLPGLAERLQDALVRKFIDSDYKVKVHAFSQFGNPRYSSFFGAAKLTATNLDSSLKISRVDFEYKGQINIPTTFMEQFSTIFEQAAIVKLEPIIVSVKNFYNRHLYQQLYNIINSRRETSLKELSNRLRRSPIELYEAVETLLSYKIILGELEGFNFINTQYEEEKEEIPIPAEVTEVKATAPRPPQQEQLYVPTFQKVQQEDLVPESKPRARQEAGYTPTFVALDDKMPGQVEPTGRRPQVGTDEYKPSFQALDEQMPDQVEVKFAVHRGPKQGAIEDSDYKPSFQQLDEQMPDQMEVKTPIHHKVQEEQAEIEGKDYEYTFQKIEEQMREKWEKDQTIVSDETKVARRAKVSDDELTFLKVEQEKAAEWEEEGLVSTPKKVRPRGIFDDLAIPVEPKEQESTFSKIDKEKVEEWEGGVKVITGKPMKARDELQALLSSAPSYVKADTEKAKEWEESGLITMPKRPKATGFFQEPSLATKEEKELPTFLKIKDQEVPQPKKVMVADLLQPKSAIPKAGVQQKQKVPTFLEGQDLTEEQLRQIKEFEEEERKKKEKREQLL